MVFLAASSSVLPQGKLAQSGPPKRSFVAMLDQHSEHGGFVLGQLDPVAQTGRAHVIDDQACGEVEMEIAVTKGGERGRFGGLGASGSRSEG